MANKKLRSFEFANHSEQGKANHSGADEVDFFECNNGSIFLICQDNLHENSETRPARLAAQRIRYYLENEYVVNPVNALYNALIYTNGFIYEYGRKNDQNIDVCVHCAIVLIRDNKAYYSTFGETAVFFYNGKKNYLLSRGDKRMHYPLQHPEADPELEANPDYLLGKCRTINPDVNIEALIPMNNDMIILASKGFYNKVSDKMISKILSDPMPVQNKVYRFIDLANIAGGEENISVQLISFYNLNNSVRQFKPLEIRRPIAVKKQAVKYSEDIESTSDRSGLEKLAEKYITRPVKYVLIVLGLVVLGYMVYDLFIYDPVPALKLNAQIHSSGENHLTTSREVTDLPVKTAPFVNQALSDTIYLVKQGDTWGRIYSQFGVCSWFIRTHSSNKGRFDTNENPVAGSRISIPLLYSGRPELNPRFYMEFSLEATGTRCENAGQALVDSFFDRHF
jgi:PPM family protein phosphatase